jgi:hypothetical protein
MGARQKSVGIGLEGGTGAAEAGGFSGLCWPDFAFDRMRVRELGVPAYCWTSDGELWEFEDGDFYTTVRGDAGGRRRADEVDAPFDGWSHPADCACPACRVARR